jgi:hypothetical protein
MRLSVLSLLCVAGLAAQTLPPGVEKKSSAGGITEYDFPNASSGKSVGGFCWNRRPNMLRSPG